MVLDINQPTEISDKRTNIIRRCYYNGIAPYDIIKRVEKADAFPSSYSYFQKKTLVEKELDEIKKADKERILAEENQEKDQKALYIARLEWMYTSAIQSGDIPNARLLAKDIATARGVSTDNSPTSELDGIASMLREVSKLGRQALAQKEEAIDITPIVEGQIINQLNDDKNGDDNLPLPIEPNPQKVGISISPNVKALILKAKKKN